MKKAILKKLSVSALVASFAFLCAGAVAHAQTIGTTSVDGIDISSAPANPAPNTNVTVSVDSYSTDLSAATISWSVNGKTMTKGGGLTSITVPAPALGNTTKVMATIYTAEGATIQKVISLTSGDVDLITETSGYVPPFYQGKTPFSYQNTVTLIAIPHLVDSNGALINPSDLIYQWKENTFALGSQSGYGKESLTVTGAVIANPINIDLTVVSTDGTDHAEKQITLQPVAPSILFYQDDPLYGVLYNSAIGSILRLIHNQTKVVAAPFSFDIPGTGYVYNWSIDGSAQSNLTNSQSVILGVNVGQTGSSVIDLGIQNTAENILQSAESSFTAVFADQSTSSAANSVF